MRIFHLVGVRRAIACIKGQGKCEVSKKESGSEADSKASIHESVESLESP